MVFPPQRTALLVIDPVNDFLSEGGAGWEMAKTTVQMHDVVSNLKRADRTVFIDVPKLVIGNLPWHEAPSRPTHEAKLGPRVAAVERLYGSRSPSIWSDQPAIGRDEP